MRFENKAWCGLRLMSSDQRFEISSNYGMEAIEVVDYDLKRGTGKHTYYKKSEVSNLINSEQFKDSNLKDFEPLIRREIEFNVLTGKYNLLLNQIQKERDNIKQTCSYEIENIFGLTIPKINFILNKVKEHKPEWLEEFENDR